MSARSDQAALASIGAAARELRLPTIRAEVARLSEIAVRDRQSYLVFLAELLAAEVDDRADRSRARRIADAKFPRLKRLSEFNVDAVTTIEPAQLATLASGHYLNAGEPVVLLGDSGTGKTHLLIGLGLAACEQGRKVRYVTCAQLVNELVEAADERILSRVVARYGRLDLLLLDEVVTSKSTLAEPNCCSRSLQNAKNEPASDSPVTSLSANGEPSSPTHASSPRSSTASPSTPTSLKPAPIPTGYALQKPLSAASCRVGIKRPDTLTVS
jgi:DNA replication protein DnaC